MKLCTQHDFVARVNEAKVCRRLCLTVGSADAVRSAGVHVHFGNNVRRRLHRRNRLRYNHGRSQHPLLERGETQRNKQFQL